MSNHRVILEFARACHESWRLVQHRESAHDITSTASCSSCHHASATHGTPSWLLKQVLFWFFLIYFLLFFFFFLFFFCLFVFPFTRLMSLPRFLGRICPLLAWKCIATFSTTWHEIVSAKVTETAKEKTPKANCNTLPSPFPSGQYGCFMLLCLGQLQSNFRTHCFTVNHSQSQVSWAKRW